MNKMEEDTKYYQERLEFLAREYLYGKISLSYIKENQGKIFRLMNNYLEVSKIPKTTDDLPLSFLVLKYALDRIN